MGDRARQPKGRHQLCSAKGVAVVRIQKYLKGGVTGQALASTPGTAQKQEHQTRDFVPQPGKDTPAQGHCRVVTAAGQ